MKKVAVIGTGIMGAGIVSNFLKNGYKVYVWNRNKKKLNNFVRKGAIALRTPREGAELADIIFEVTADDKSSRYVWAGKDGILAGAKKNSILVTCATISVGWVDKLIKLCNKNGFTFFDMPMTGGRGGAESGNLVLLVGGNEQKLKKLKPTLKAISRETIYFGKEGSGIKFKLLLNMLQAIHVAGFGEVMKIAKESKMNLNTVGDALSKRPGGVVTNLAWRDYKVSPNPINFSAKWMKKDLEYAKKFGGKQNSSLLIDTLKKYKKAIKSGLGNKDWTIINK